jgi:hypothetical protein
MQKKEAAAAAVAVLLQVEKAKLVQPNRTSRAAVVCCG